MQNFSEELFYNRYTHPTHDFFVCEAIFLILFSASIFFTKPLDRGRKLNVHKTFRRHPGRLLNVRNVLCTFDLLSAVSRGKIKQDLKKISSTCVFLINLTQLQLSVIKKILPWSKKLKYLIILNPGAKTTGLLKLRLIGFLNSSQVNISDIYENLWQCRTCSRQ